MSGAFTAVADDASAVYWNPAGLAAGAIISVVADLHRASATPDGSLDGREGSSFLLALSTPALGLGYYRLRSTSTSAGIQLLPENGLTPPGSLTVVGEQRIASLLTHHAGVTVVQSIVQGVAVGSTLKFVRGVAAIQSLPGVSPEDALEAGADLIGRATNRFDLDVGVIAFGGPFKAGITMRNVTAPEFPVTGDDEVSLRLERQARAGVAYAVSSNWIAAADLDLTRTTDVFGERRDFAAGVEGRLGTRAWIRSGVRFNTVGDGAPPRDDRRAASYSIGGSFAARAGLLLDGHFSAGDGRAGQEWGIGARFVY